MPWKTESVSRQRWAFVREHLAGKSSLTWLCRRWRISRKTAYKWLERFRDRGRFGLADQPRQAHRVHNRPTAVWQQRIRRWRARHPSWGARKLHWALARRFGNRGLPSAASIGRWLRAWRLTRARRRPSARRGPVVARPRLTLARVANEVWTVDFKGWFRTKDGTRVEPLTVRDLASRYVLAVRLLRRQTVRECQRSMAGVFGKYGLPRVIRADNGSPFGAGGALGLTRLSAWWVKLGIRVEFIEPGHPEQNGAHEQMHRVYLAEVAQPPARTQRGQQRRSERWREHYNHERPHEGLGMRVPAELYRASRRRLRPVKPWRYPRTWESRLVRSHGQITFRGRSRFVGEAFEGERVGLEPRAPGVWRVHFGPLIAGELWAEDAGGLRAVRYSQRRQKS